MEEWRAIPEFEELYEISDLGRVRSLDRTTERMSRWGTLGSRRFAGRVIRPGLNRRDGYRMLLLYRDGRRTVKTVHAAVMEAFVGPRPGGQEVCHNNNDKQDNRLVNLRYDTPSGNSSDKLIHGTLIKGEQCHLSRLTRNDVIAIRSLRGVLQQRELAARFGTTHQNISCIQLRKSWRHV